MNSPLSTLNTPLSISVIICTYNRCESLRRTLQTCCDLIIPEGVTWELLVVDNNSTDATKQVCESFASKLPLRYLFESHQGKSNALNQGVAESRGNLVIFTDDDVNLERRWLIEIVSAAQRYPEAKFFGGRVLPHWETPPPRWAVDNIDWLRVNVHVDKGQEERIVVAGTNPYFVGANLACRKSVFDSGLHFRSDIGPTGPDHSIGGHLRGEEILLEVQMLNRGNTGVYIPTAVVYHRHAPHRQTEKYLRRWYRGESMAETRLGQTPCIRPWFGVPRYYWKMLILSTIKYILTRPVCPSRTWLAAEIQIAQALGVITEFRRSPQKEAM